MHDEMNEKKWADITKMIKVISDSVRDYFNRAKNDNRLPDQDTSLMAMQVLSILCGLNRGYSMDKIDKLWAASISTAKKIHESKTNDKIMSKLQIPIGYENRDKN